METPTKRRPGRPHAPVQGKGRLREIRIERGKTQEDLAEFLGVPQSVISEAELTGKGLGDKKWQRLAVFLSSDVLTLRGWTKIFN